MEDERPISTFVPDNIQTGINVLGKAYTFSRLVEGGALAIVFGISNFLILRKLLNDMTTIISVSLCVALVFGAFGVMGINDEALHEFIINVIKFIKRKRVTYYNPRIKDELKPITIDSSDTGNENLLPRDILLKKYDEFKMAMDEKNRNRMLENESNNDSENIEMVFEDDQMLQEKGQRKKNK